LDLVDLVLSLPASSAECERGFSVMKHTKTDYRNKLTSKTMTHVIRVKLHAAGIEEYDPTPAIHQWNLRARKPGFKQTKQERLHDALTLQAAESAAVSTPADDDVGEAVGVTHDNINQPDNFTDSDFSEYDFSESDSSGDDGDIMDLVNDVE
jgi:hypothetical protein